MKQWTNNTPDEEENEEFDSMLSANRMKEQLVELKKDKLSKAATKRLADELTELVRIATKVAVNDSGYDLPDDDDALGELYSFLS